MAPAEGIRVELAFSPAPREVELQPLTLPAGSTVLQALRAGRWHEQHPEIDPAQWVVGVWGRRVPLSQMLCDGDRIEVYRPLQVNPKEARRLRYRAQGDRGRVRRKKPEPA